MGQSGINIRTTERVRCIPDARGCTAIRVSPSQAAVLCPEGKTATITVGQFFKDHEADLQLKLVGDDRGFDRKIHEPTINRPGLALTGFFKYFAHKRIQVVGSAELAYLRNLSDGDMADRFRQMCLRRVPCVIFSRNAAIPPSLEHVAALAGISLFRTPLVTMNFVNAATIALEFDFSPTCCEL